MLTSLLQPVPLLLLLVVVVYTGILWHLLKRLRRLQKEAQPMPQPSLVATSSSLDQQRFIDKADEAMRLTQTFQKFVPRQFVDHFAKHGSKSLELGHADEDDVAILFCDIRGFTSLSENMRPQELMKFLNSYFLRMNDPIHQNGGFIDKFIGDAIMALFDHPDGTSQDKARDALKAAIDLRTALHIYNQHRKNSGYPPINTGVGIHFGPVILGTVGSDDRMDTTVIGDSVNIAYRLEALAPVYNADIVVSAQVLQTAQASEHFNYRLLDWVRVKGRKQPIELFEILDHLPISQRQQKLSIAPLISQGVKLRKEQNWQAAIDCFQEALSLSPKDELVVHHLEICHRLKHNDLSEDWDGATRT